MEKIIQKRIVQKTSIIQILPFVICIITTFLVPFQILVLDNLHIYVLILGILYLVLINFGKKNSIPFSSFLVVLLIVISICFSSLKMPSFLIPLVGATDYLFPFVFWILYFQSNSNFDMNIWQTFLTVLGGFVSFWGIYQRFVDQTLFGIMNRINSYYDFETLDRVSVFRISSFMPSTQVFSLFVGITSAILISSWNEIRLKEIWKIILLIITLAGGIIAGGKIFILLIVIPVVFKLKVVLSSNKIKIYKGVLIVIPIILLFAIYIFSKKELLNIFLNSLDRLFFVLNLGNGEFTLADEAIRIERMRAAFGSDIITVLTGHGLGTCSYSAYNSLSGRFDFERITLESYGLSWFYEMGVIGIIALLLLVLEVYKCIKHTNPNYKCVLMSFFVGMFFTPAYYSLCITAFWAFVFFIPLAPNSNTVRIRLL